MNPTASASKPSHAGATASAQRAAPTGAAHAATGDNAGDAFAALMNELFAGGDAPLPAGGETAGPAKPGEDAPAKPGSRPATQGAATDPLALLANALPTAQAAPAVPPADWTLRLPAAAAGDGDKGSLAATTRGTAGRGKPQAGADDLGLLPAAGGSSPAAHAAGKAPPTEPFAAALAQVGAARAGESREPAAGAHLALDGVGGAAHALPAAAAGPAAPAHQAALASQPLDTAFPGDLAAEVKVMVEGGLQTAELHLNPTELGPIRIELSIDGQNADIAFAAAHGTTREGIEQAIPELREMLAEQGLSLNHTGVSSGQQEGFAQARDAQAQAAEARRAGAPARGEGAAEAAPVQPVAVRAGRGLLDLYA